MDHDPFLYFLSVFFSSMPKHKIISPSITGATGYTVMITQLVFSLKDHMENIHPDVDYKTRFTRIVKLTGTPFNLLFQNNSMYDRKEHCYFSWYEKTSVTTLNIIFVRGSLQCINACKHTDNTQMHVFVCMYVTYLRRCLKSCFPRTRISSQRTLTCRHNKTQCQLKSLKKYSTRNDDKWKRNTDPVKIESYLLCC